MIEPVNISEYGFDVLQIETKSICNMACQFCSYPIRADKGQELSKDVVYALIDSLIADESLRHVCFSQFNEPLMDARIYDFISYAKSKGVKVLLVTNALLFKSKEVIEKLVKAEPDFVRISLHTLNDEMFKNARGTHCSFEDYRQWIYDYLKEAVSTNSKITIDTACNFLSFRRSLKTGIFGLNRGDPSVYKSIDYLRNDLEEFLKGWQHVYNFFQFDKEELSKFLKSLTISYLEQDEFRMAENIFLKVKKFTYGRLLRDFYPVSVSAGCGSRELGVLASGNVVPCCLCYGDILKMGNVKEMSLDQILKQNKDLLKRIRSGNDFPPICSKCVGAPTRRGAIAQSIRNYLIKVLKK